MSATMKTPNNNKSSANGAGNSDEWTTVPSRSSRTQNRARNSSNSNSSRHSTPTRHRHSNSSHRQSSPRRQRSYQPRPKTLMCTNHCCHQLIQGVDRCRFGNRCNYGHVETDLTASPIATLVQQAIANQDWSAIDFTASNADEIEAELERLSKKCWRHELFHTKLQTNEATKDDFLSRWVFDLCGRCSQ